MDLQPQVLIKKLTDTYGGLHYTLSLRIRRAFLSERRLWAQPPHRRERRAQKPSSEDRCAAWRRWLDGWWRSLSASSGFCLAPSFLFSQERKENEAQNSQQKKNLGTMHVLNQKPTVSKNEDSNLPKFARWTQKVLMRFLSTTSRELGRITYGEIFLKFKWVLKQSLYI